MATPAAFSRLQLAAALLGKCARDLDNEHALQGLLELQNMTMIQPTLTCLWFPHMTVLSSLIFDEV